MARQIKFRAWDEVEKKMHYFDLYDIEKPRSLGGQIPYKREDGVDVYFNTWRQPIMQFTGLIDRNGKEMYEGDIVKQTFGRRILTGTMIFDEKRATFGFNAVIDTKQEIEGNHLVMRHPSEVIGNIYENPELIS